MQFVYGPDINHYVFPEIIAESSRGESKQDMDYLGRYCDETHESYMRLSEDRIRQLKKFTAKVINSSTNCELEVLNDVCQLAYSVRHSSSFKHFIQANLNRKPKPGISLPTTPKIIERLGKISRFYRAALAMTDFVTKVKELGRKIIIETIPAQKIRIPELADRTAAQLCARAGHRVRSDDINKFGRMLERWPRYRQHAELQLIVFYEENPRFHIYSNYIGCDKQACYLCFNFIKYHARFEVDGGHQSLYSLWTVKDTINFTTLERAREFQSALKKVCLDVETQIQHLKATYWHRLGFETANESVPNLSRISLSPAWSSSQKVLHERSITPQTHLAPIQEASPDDHEETMGHEVPNTIDQLHSAIIETAVPPSIRSLPDSAQALSPVTTSTVLRSSSPDPQIPPPDVPASPPDTVPTPVPSPPVKGLPVDVSSHASDDPVVISDVVSQRSKVASPTLDSITSPFSATSAVSLQFQEADTLSESKAPVCNTQESTSAVPLHHYEHRKRHRHLHSDAPPPDETIPHHYTLLSGQRISERENNDPLRESGRSQHRKRRRNHSIRYQQAELLTKRDGGYSPTAISSRKGKRPRRRPVHGGRHHERQPNLKEQRHSSVLKAILRKFRHFLCGG